MSRLCRRRDRHQPRLVQELQPKSYPFRSSFPLFCLFFFQVFSFQNQQRKKKSREKPGSQGFGWPRLVASAAERWRHNRRRSARLRNEDAKRGVRKKIKKQNQPIISFLFLWGNPFWFFFFHPPLPNEAACALLPLRLCSSRCSRSFFLLLGRVAQALVSSSQSESEPKSEPDSSESDMGSMAKRRFMIDSTSCRSVRDFSTFSTLRRLIPTRRNANAKEKKVHRTSYNCSIPRAKSVFWKKKGNFQRYLPFQ